MVFNQWAVQKSNGQFIITLLDSATSRSQTLVPMNEEDAKAQLRMLGISEGEIESGFDKALSAVA